MVVTLYYIIVMGPAGSGKSTLTHALSSWIEDHEMSVTRVNFDPAADSTPYTPDVDVRSYINVKDVMSKYGLGPNGALIAAVDMLVNHISDIKNEIESFNDNYVIVDMPGQLEIVAFRRVGPLLINYLTEGRKSVALFLIDSYLTLSPLSTISMLLLSISTMLRMGKPQIIALTKADLLSSEQEVRLINMFDEEFRCDDLIESRDIVDIELALRLCETVKESTIDVIPTSAVSGKGLDEIYAAVQRVLGYGEDYLTEEPSGKL
ncbi:MAG: ATP/GTP-binding protein [Sulfolobales archaeon]|nr:ATP/GTP-binding protein [Sulfolobales archaeon]